MPEHARVIRTLLVTRSHDFGEPLAFMLVLVVCVRLGELDYHLLIIWIVLNLVVIKLARVC